MDAKQYLLGSPDIILYDSFQTLELGAHVWTGANRSNCLGKRPRLVRIGQQPLCNGLGPFLFALLFELVKTLSDYAFALRRLRYGPTYCLKPVLIRRSISAGRHASQTIFLGRCRCCLTRIHVPTTCSRGRASTRTCRSRIWTASCAAIENELIVSASTGIVSIEACSRCPGLIVCSGCWSLGRSRSRIAAAATCPSTASE